MQITLNIAGADLSQEVKGILEGLTQEEKKDFAKSIMLQWLKEPVDFERQVKEKEVLETVKRYLADQSSTYNKRTVTDIPDKEAREHYKFRELIKDWKSTKEEMIMKIVSETITFYQTLATQLVREDPQTLQIWEKVKEVIIQSYPSYVHDATVKFFADHMFGLRTGIDQAIFSGNNVKNDLNQVRAAVGLPQTFN